MNKYLHFFGILTFSLSSLLLSTHVSAVGTGVNFSVKESNVPAAFKNSFTADSLDLTYQACVLHDKSRLQFVEHGFFWVSSYQSNSGVMDSQINYYVSNGYRIYGIYNFGMKQRGPSQATPTGKRLNYVINSPTASITLFLDIDSNTEMKMTKNCKISSNGRLEDLLLGRSSTIALGEKSETNGLANGDFEVIFSKWAFNITLLNPIIPFFKETYDILRFNANITRLRGALGTHHYPEGSGNIFWQSRFATKPSPILK